MNDLVRYDAACLALAEAKAVDEVKLIRDQAAAMAAAARIAKNHALEIDAAEIRIRAERRLGEMIAAVKEAGGMAPPGPTPRSVPHENRTPTLADAGIDKKLSARSPGGAGWGRRWSGS